MIYEKPADGDDVSYAVFTQIRAFQIVPDFAAYFRLLLIYRDLQ